MTRKHLFITLTIASCGLIVAFGVWWINRPTKPTTAMESMVSYWQKWSDDTVREKVHAWVRDRSDLSPEEIQGAAEVVGGVQGIELYRRALERSPNDPTLHWGLVRSLSGFEQEASEVIIDGGRRGEGDLVEDNVSQIVDELSIMADLDPQNAAVDYLLAYVALKVRAEDAHDVLPRLGDSVGKGSFDDYSLDGARKAVVVLTTLGLTQIEARIAMLRNRLNPLRSIWVNMGDILELRGRCFLLEQDSENAERAYRSLIDLGERLASMNAWLDDNVTGWQLQGKGLNAMADLRTGQGREAEARDDAEKGEEANRTRDELEAFRIETPLLSTDESMQERRGRMKQALREKKNGLHKMMTLSAEELDRFLEAYLSRGANAANPLLKHSNPFPSSEGGHIGPPLRGDTNGVD